METLFCWLEVVNVKAKRERENARRITEFSEYPTYYQAVACNMFLS